MKRRASTLPAVFFRLERAATKEAVSHKAAHACSLDSCPALGALWSVVSELAARRSVAEGRTLPRMDRDRWSGYTLECLRGARDERAQEEFELRAVGR